jgi:DNA primase
MSGWINFKELRSKLDFELVLRHYGVDVKRKGDQHHGFCPLPNHGGNKNSPSFSANLTRGIFQCFGCGAKGNVLEFAAYMEKVDLEDGSALRGVALKLQARFCAELAKESERTEKRQASNPAGAPKVEPTPTPTVVINAPLDFELKGLDAAHPYLLGRGFTSETIKYFGAGFCSRGMLKDRVAIPLHDSEGRLVGYAGRLVDDKLVNNENPKYRFPGTRTRDGKRFEFRKSLFLYNGFRLQKHLDDVIVVEGFFSVWWLHQCGFRQVVATTGADCSKKQAELIVSFLRPGGRVWIIPDGDQAGERVAQSLFAQISPFHFVRWVKLAKDTQPTDLSAEQLKTTFAL